ncbi:MAG TPA: metal-dependent hydrolase, partial [Acidimicrobiia bacterium]|nr:metal-dependent hydrolase [Acidimicrobiia bacterium]
RMTTTTQPADEITTRRLVLDFAKVPHHFAAGGDLMHSHLGAALSAVFPDGERYFVRSVRNFRDQLDDVVLKRQVAGFIGQEAMHGTEHRLFNERLDELGYPTKWFERFTDKGLRFRERILPPIHNLAATAALEHYTATLAELLLESDETRALFGDETVKHLFVWHALEESEHKAVAFDVYKAVGGSERVRVFNMNLITATFLTVMTAQMTVSLLTDRETYRPGNFVASWRRFWRSPVMQPRVWRRLRDYNRPGFHPNDHDSSAIIERWRAELFGAGGVLRDQLAAGAKAST